MGTSWGFSQPSASPLQHAEGEYFSDAFRADAASKFRVAMRGQVHFHLHPVSGIIPRALAPCAYRQKFSEGSDFPQEPRQSGFPLSPLPSPACPLYES